MRVSQIVSAVSWKHAVGEVLLIVVGISIALSVDSWWQGQQERQEEDVMLSQVLATLRSDRAALATISTDVQNRASLLTELQRHLERELPYADSLTFNLRALRRWQTSTVSTAAYEDLKGRGLDLVSNQELRWMLIDYFDRQVPLLEDYDRFDQDLTMSYSSTVLQRHLMWSDDVYLPVDYSRMVEDTEFRYMVGHREEIMRQGTVRRYQAILSASDDLIAALEAALADR